MAPDKAPARRRSSPLWRWIQRIRSPFLPARLRSLSSHEWREICVGLTRWLDRHPRSRELWPHLEWLEQCALPKGLRGLTRAEPHRLAAAERELAAALTPTTPAGPWLLHEVIEMVLDWMSSGLFGRLARPRKRALVDPHGRKRDVPTLRDPVRRT
ncbi:hypothetical protein HZ992_12515 [Rhizobacter sp. AJA081-3]|uniref:hypothetical protein n=1 Tax=Rhizobacter sp. AJA081-3 TaxID=2753607 RepID=UPI001ADF8F0E|nr:hypothetical protein [Rhizobacter sp. AJA081-3]QTN25719.1 hypothetical protein HZ992_12515 [Rhizobacter sp. AJA081-3]